MIARQIYTELINLRRKTLQLEEGLSHVAPAEKSTSPSIQYLQAVISIISEAVETMRLALTDHPQSENSQNDPS